jgi:hypothetical protein
MIFSFEYIFKDKILNLQIYIIIGIGISRKHNFLGKNVKREETIRPIFITNSSVILKGMSSKYHLPSNTLELFCSKCLIDIVGLV